MKMSTKANNILRFAIAFRAAVMCFECVPVAGHQIPLEDPPASEIARTEPPLEGSSEFLRAAPAYLRGRCNGEDDHAQLDSIERRLREASHIRWGADGVSQRVAEYQRWKAEREIIDLMLSMPDLLRIDAQSGRPTKESDDKVHLNAQAPSLLLRIDTGKGPTAFFTADWNLQREAHPEDFEVQVADQGTTFVLLRLANVPAGATQERFCLRRTSDSDPFRWHGVKVSTPAWGHLALNLQDETGKPTPAIIRLRSARDGSLWEPPDALDMRPQLNNVVSEVFVDFGPDQGYTFFLPGERGGRYWIVGPNQEFPLPDGGWELRIQHGPEYFPVTDTFSISADTRSRKQYELKRWINMPAKGWWSGDDHVHARLMSKADADRLITYSKAVDLHVANILEMGDVARTYYAQRGFGTEFRVQDGDYCLIPGQEDPRSVLGHAIGLNLQEKVRDLDHYLQNDVLAERIHQQGGLYGHTHVGANACFADRELALFTPMGIVDFNSIMQADLGTELYYNMLNLGFKMTASAGADTPYGGTIGAVRTYVYTGNTDRLVPDEWFAALRHGRTFVTNGPMIDFRVNDNLAGEVVALTEASGLQVQVKASGIPGGSAVKELRVVRCGDVVERSTSEDPDEGELSLELEVDSGKGCWIAAHAIGHDGSQAHTTPVYVSVNGHRHWAENQVQALLEKQLEILDQVEAAIDESVSINQENADPLDYWNRVNAAQADAVRERVERTRQVYQSMRNEHKQGDE